MSLTFAAGGLTRSTVRKNASLILALVVSLLFMTQVPMPARAAEVKPRGQCAAEKCALGCCTDMACCAAAEQRSAPQTPAPAPQQNDVQLATIGLRAFTLLFTPPAPRQPFVVPTETGAARTLSPLAASCIWRI
jgi:hypothetical protein